MKGKELSKNLPCDDSRFYCAVCDGRFEAFLDRSINASLDSHLRVAHNIDVGVEDGKATLDKNGIKPSEYPRGVPFIFRRVD